MLERFHRLSGFIRLLASSEQEEEGTVVWLGFQEDLKVGASLVVSARLDVQLRQAAASTIVGRKPSDVLIIELSGLLLTSGILGALPKDVGVLQFRFLVVGCDLEVLLIKPRCLLEVPILLRPRCLSKHRPIHLLNLISLDEENRQPRNEDRREQNRQPLNSLRTHPFWSLT